MSSSFAYVTKLHQLPWFFSLLQISFFHKHFYAVLQEIMNCTDSYNEFLFYWYETYILLFVFMLFYEQTLNFKGKLYYNVFEGVLSDI